MKPLKLGHLDTSNTRSLLIKSTKVSLKLLMYPYNEYEKCCPLYETFKISTEVLTITHDIVISTLDIVISSDIIPRSIVGIQKLASLQRNKRTPQNASIVNL